MKKGRQSKRRKKRRKRKEEEEVEEKKEEEKKRGRGRRGGRGEDVSRFFICFNMTICLGCKKIFKKLKITS